MKLYRRDLYETNRVRCVFAFILKRSAVCMCAYKTHCKKDPTGDAKSQLLWQLKAAWFLFRRNA